MAENVQELIIKYRADVSELQDKVSQIEAELRKIPQSAAQAGTATAQAFNRQTGLIENSKRRLEQLTVARDQSNDPVKITRFNDLIRQQSTRIDELTGKQRNITSNVTPMGQAFDSLGKSIVAAFAVERVIAFGAESVKAFQEAERNAVKLQSAVSVNGGLQEDFDALINQSERLQDTTIFSDDAIQNAQTAALQFGLTRQEVQRLIPIVADFASATGQDLQSALEQVLQGVNGSERALKKYGVTVSESGTRASRLDEITQQLTRNFEGQAEVIGETAFGAAEKYKNEIDDLQEEIGEQLAPALQTLQLALLKTSQVFVTAASGPSGYAVALGKLFAANSFAGRFDELKNTFKGKFETKSVEELTALYTKLAAEQSKLTGDARTEALAKQAAALELLKEKTRQTTGDTGELASALERLKNITALSDSDLQQLAITLSKFNDKDARDAIDAINKELAERQKVTGKIIEEKKRGIDELHKLEQEASDRILSVKSAEVSEVLKLEQDKQKEIRDLINAAGTASGADVEPIVLEFESTGRADIDRTIELLKQAKFPQAEIDKFTLAVGRTNDAFDILISKQKEASKELELKINQENIQSDFNDLQAQFEAFQEREEILLQVKFIQAGDFSPEAIKKLDADIVASRAKTNTELIAQAQKMGVDINIINKLIAANAKAANDAEILANAEKTAAILQQEQELADRRREIIQDIQDTAIEFAEQLITVSIDKKSQADLEAIERVKTAEQEAIDERITANDDRLNKGIIGEREAEQNHERLLQEKKKADDRADAAERLIKRKQFKNDQLAAVAKVVIANTVNAAEFPALAGFYAGLAIAQSALILSEPNPYKKGSKNTKKGLSIVGEEGPEFVMMPQGAKVVTAQKTKRHAKIIDAIMDDRLDEHIQKSFVEPALVEERKKSSSEKKSSKRTKDVVKESSNKDIIEAIYSNTVDEYLRELQIVPHSKKQDVLFESKINHGELNNMLARLQVSPVLKQAEKSYEIQKQADFATNIANSIFLNQQGMTRKDYREVSDENRRRGTYIRNANEIVDPILQAIAPLKQPSYKR